MILSITINFIQSVCSSKNCLIYNLGQLPCHNLRVWELQYLNFRKRESSIWRASPWCDYYRNPWRPYPHLPYPPPTVSFPYSITPLTVPFTAALCPLTIIDRLTSTAIKILLNKRNSPTSCTFSSRNMGKVMNRMVLWFGDMRWWEFWSLILALDFSICSAASNCLMKCVISTFLSSAVDMKSPSLPLSILSPVMSDDIKSCIHIDILTFWHPYPYLVFSSWQRSLFLLLSLSLSWNLAIILSYL